VPSSDSQLRAVNMQHSGSCNGSNNGSVNGNQRYQGARLRNNSGQPSASQDHVNFGKIANQNMMHLGKAPTSNLPKVQNQKLLMNSGHNMNRSLSSSGQKILGVVPNS
jgi:hypothetical protein